MTVVFVVGVAAVSLLSGETVDAGVATSRHASSPIDGAVADGSSPPSTSSAPPSDPAVPEPAQGTVPDLSSGGVSELSSTRAPGRSGEGDPDLAGGPGGDASAGSSHASAGVAPSVLAGTQQTALAVGIALSDVGLGSAVLREPELRSAASDAAGSAILGATIARVTWTAVPPPPPGPLAAWYGTFEGGIVELEAAADALAQGLQPSTSEAEAASLADAVDRHLEAAREALIGAAALLEAPA